MKHMAVLPPAPDKGAIALRSPRIAVEDACARLRRALNRVHLAAFDLYDIAYTLDPKGRSGALTVAEFAMATAAEIADYSKVVDASVLPEQVSTRRRSARIATIQEHAA